MDDSGLLGAFALSPHILLAVDIDGQADGGGAEGVYLELGIEPGFTLAQGSAYPLSVAFPLTLGLSLSDYYEHPVTGNDETFGYFDAGIALALPLSFIPESFGSWGISVAGHFLILGDSAKALNNGDDFKALATVGISLAY